MASSKDVELILKARLDQGDSISNAQSIGKGIADTIEAAFDGIGERIADKMLREIQSILSQAQIGLQHNGSGLQLLSGYSPAVAPTPTSGSSAPRDAFVRRDSSVGHEFQGAGPNWSYYEGHNSSDSSFNRRSRDDFFSQFKQTNASDHFGSMGKIHEAIMDRRARVMGIRPEEHSQWLRGQNSDIIGADSVISRFESYKQAKDTGANVSLDDFDLSKQGIRDARAQYGALAGDAAKESNALAQAIERLQVAINENTAATKEEERWLKALGKEKEDKEALRALREDKLRTSIETKEGVDETRSRMSARQGTLKDIEKESGVEGWVSRNRRGLGVAGGLLTAGAFMTSEYANQDIYKRQAAAGTASLENFSSRMAMNQDFGSMFAMEQLGGQSALRSQSEKNVRTRNLSSGLMALGQVGVGSAMAIGTGGLASLAGGGIALSGLSQLNDLRKRGMFFDRDIASEMNQNVELYKNENPEIMKLLNTGGANYTNAWEISKSLGNTGSAAWLSGETGNKLVSHGTDFGLGSGDVRQAQASLISSIDPSSGDRSHMTLRGVDRNFKDLLALQGRGFNYGTELISGYRQSMGPTITSEQKEDATEYSLDKAKGFGYDLAATNNLTQMQKNMIGSASARIMNMGSGLDFMGEDFGRSIANQFSREGITSNAAMSARMQTEQDLRFGNIAGNGYEGVGAGVAVNKLQKKLGLQFTGAERIDFLDSKALMTAGGVLDLYKDRNMNIEDSDEFKKAKRENSKLTAEEYAKQVALEFNNSRTNETLKNLSDEELALRDMHRFTSHDDKRRERDRTKKGLSVADSLDVNGIARNAINDKNAPSGSKAEDVSKAKNKMAAAELEASFKAMDTLIPTFATRISELTDAFANALAKVDKEKADNIKKAAENMQQLADQATRMSLLKPSTGLSPRDVYSLSPANLRALGPKGRKK